MEDTITIQQVIDLMNEALNLDREAITNLVRTRVVCNKALTEHPTIQVGGEDPNIGEVGLLGIINGLFSKTKGGWGKICTISENGFIERFSLTEKETKGK